MAERAIQTIIYMAGTFMVHVSLHWIELGLDDFSLWDLLSNMLPGYVITFQTELRLQLIIGTCCVPMYGVALCVSLIPSFRMKRIYPRGIIILSLVNS
eukprot:CCRYP_015430-RA/>CCRYP_015430-RA protein AED:0.21 eAED:0.58 QI:0/-1/0/1/-1/0/1/0/97